MSYCRQHANPHDYTYTSQVECDWLMTKWGLYVDRQHMEYRVWNWHYICSHFEVIPVCTHRTKSVYRLTRMQTCCNIFTHTMMTQWDAIENSPMCPFLSLQNNLVFEHDQNFPSDYQCHYVHTSEYVCCQSLLYNTPLEIGERSIFQGGKCFFHSVWGPWKVIRKSTMTWLLVMTTYWLFDEFDGFLMFCGKIHSVTSD